MRNIFYFLLLISLSLLIDCKHHKVEEIQVDENRVHRINVDSTYGVIDLKLSDLADSFRLVRLETSKGSIISARDYYVSDKYIIAVSQDGIYKFSSNGKFLSKILSYGRGPDEISGMLYGYFYDENNDLLYLTDSNLKQKLLVYDLDSDKFIDPIKRAFPGYMSQFAIYNDSLIIWTFASTTEPYVIIYQNFDGKFISGIPSTKKTLWGDNPQEQYQGCQLSIGQNTYRISFAFDDTLFTLKENQLIPYIILGFKKPRENPPNSKPQKGDRKIYFQRTEPSSFLVINVANIEEITWFATGGRSKQSYKYFFFDKSIGKSSIIRTYEDDFTGDIQSSSGVISPNMYGTIKLPLFLNNDKVIVIYEPGTIKKIAERAESGKLNSILTPSIKEELISINKSIVETDNPVLLIGKVKKKI